MDLSNEGTLTQIEMWAMDINDTDSRTVILKLCSEVRELRRDKEKLQRDLSWEQNPNRFKNVIARKYIVDSNMLHHMKKLT